MKIMKKKNTYTIENDTVRVDIHTKKFPEAEMLIDLNDWLMLAGLQNDGELGRISCWKGRLEHTRYARAWINGKLVKVHRLLLPNSIMVDHISRDGLDNRRSNIRDTNSEMNQRNCRMRSDNSSGVTGVYRNKRLKK